MGPISVTGETAEFRVLGPLEAFSDDQEPVRLPRAGHGSCSRCCVRPGQVASSGWQADAIAVYHSRGLVDGPGT